MTSDEQIKDLQKEIRILQKIADVKRGEAVRNKNAINELYRMADLLQSFIPDKERWRDVFLTTAN
jgi:hypothetical protein